MKTSLSLLDFKLGLRMLVKYPGLSLVAVVGMAVAIAAGAGSFAFVSTMSGPAWPLRDPGRLVAIRDIRVDNGEVPDRASLHDFAAWRGELKSIRELSAYRTETRNLAVPGASPELVRTAEMTASGFRVAGVAPALGRPLLEADERPSAPPVVVIAHEEWQRRFGGDPRILGRPVRLGETVHTVVGVMPDGYLFPVNHRFWVPLRLNPADYAPGESPPVDIFGRLAEGATIRQARAELAAIGQRTAASLPAPERTARPVVLPYTHPVVGIGSPATALIIRLVQLFVSAMVLVIAVNVAILIYARTAARMGEIAVRTALGASRGRVVAQLFAEALVLSAASAAVGLTLAGMGLSIANRSMASGPQEMPFWIRFGLTPGVVAYAMGMAVAAGVIVGVLPALKATGRNVQTRIQQFSSHGARMQLGRTWTALIVIQVALAVAALPYALNFASQTARDAMGDPGYADDRFLRAQLSMEREAAPPTAEAEAYERAYRARFATRAQELLRSLREEPRVAGVTYVSYFPGQERYAELEAERAAAAGAEGERRWAGMNAVDTGFFGVFGVPLLAGRGFVAADGREGSTAVVVNQVFAERLGGSGPVLGRRIRLAADPEVPGSAAGPWYEIVGIVPHFPTAPSYVGLTPKVYRPAAVGDLASPILLLRIGRGESAAFAGRLRQVAAAVDPALQLHEMRGVAEDVRRDRKFSRYTALMTVIGTLSVLLLTAAGIYAMMAFTIVRRRREIGIRAALGADGRRVLSGILARACGQIGAGVLAGLVLAAAVGWVAGGALITGKTVVLWPVVAVLIGLVGLLAALGPARRGLRIEPSEALRADG